MQSLVRDLRFGLRTLIKTPGFTGVVVLTLALGIGANTAIFSLVHGVLLKPLDFENPEGLVSLWEHTLDDAGGRHKTRVTAANYLDWRAENSVFEAMAVFGSAGFNWTGEGEPESLLGARVSANYFEVLGVEPVLGRHFLPEENEPGSDHVVVLGHALWQRRFGGAPDVVGKTLTFDGAPYEVVGVAPPGVYPTWPQATGRIPFLPAYQQIFVPISFTDTFASNRRSHVFGVVARLREGATIESARAEMDTIARRLEDAYPRQNAGEGVLVRPFMDELVSGARPALLVLLGAVGLVLLIACANVAGLLLARAAGRRRELALCTALGAGRLALVRQQLAECFLLALAGGVLGMGLAAATIDGLVRSSPQHVPRLADAGLDGAVLSFAFAVSVVMALLCGGVPALVSSSPEIANALESGTRSTRRLGLRRVLVVGEISLAVIVVMGAALMIQSFWHLQRIDLGFRARNVLVAEIALPASSYPDASRISRFYGELLDRLESSPRVETAAIAYDHPLDSNWIDSFRIAGRVTSSAETEESLGATFRIVSAAYFRTMGIDVVRGRAFDVLDDLGRPGAAIVNESFAKRYFPDEDALGRKLVTSTPRGFWGESTPELFEIVGIVRNVKFLGPRAGNEPAFYVPARQFPQRTMTVVARTAVDPAAMAPSLRETVWGIDRTLPVGTTTTMARLRSAALAGPRFNTVLLSLFGAAALCLAALGIYGLLSYDVTQRASEIGIRMALGAGTGDVERLVVRQGAGLTAIGLGIGAASAFVAARIASGLLFGVSPHDPLTLVAVAVFLTLVALAASYLPARRAARIAPVTALGIEN